MITAPRAKVHKRAWKEFIKKHDIHKWIIAAETGQGGYEHWQVRLDTSASFEEIQSAFPGAHIEKSTQWCDYERKEGKFVQSGDNNLILSCRYGKLRKNQRRVIRELGRQSDRGVLIWYDPSGCCGKSWFIRHLYEVGKGLYVPPTLATVQGIIQFVASSYRGQKYILVDIPRNSKWTSQLYEGLETLKDGLVYEARYHPDTKDIWGVKVLVTTNTLPKLDNLSRDRWTIVDRDGRIINEVSLP